MGIWIDVATTTILVWKVIWAWVVDMEILCIPMSLLAMAVVFMVSLIVDMIAIAKFSLQLPT